ncbi:MAG: hypothetical protein ABEI77_01645 [Halorientalis sp.]
MPHQLSRGTTEPGSLPMGDVMDALGTDQRRRLVRVLSTVDGPVTVHKLAYEIAITIDQPPGHEQLTTTLHHNHLPRLDDLGIVSYDPKSNTVETTASIEQLLPCLEYLEAKQRQ